MHPSRPSSLDLVEAGDLPSDRFCCPGLPCYSLPLRLLAEPRTGLRLHGLIPALPRAADPRPREVSRVALMALPAFRSPYAGGFFEAALPESSPLPWPSRSLKRSAPACSPCGAHMSTLQDSLDGTDSWVALPSQEDTALHHPQSPGSSGGLLRGSLAITTTGLPPVSHQDLSRRTNRWLGQFSAHYPWFGSSIHARFQLIIVQDISVYISAIVPRNRAVTDLHGSEDERIVANRFEDGSPKVWLQIKLLLCAVFEFGLTRNPSKGSIALTRTGGPNFAIGTIPPSVNQAVQSLARANQPVHCPNSPSTLRDESWSIQRLAHGHGEVLPPSHTSMVSIS